MKNPPPIKLTAIILLFAPLFFIACLPSVLATGLLIDYLDGDKTGRQVGIIFLFPACIAVTFFLSLYIMRLIRFLFYPLEKLQ